MDVINRQSSNNSTSSSAIIVAIHKAQEKERAAYLPQCPAPTHLECFYSVVFNFNSGPPSPDFIHVLKIRNGVNKR